MHNHTAKNILVTGGAGFIGCNYIRHKLATDSNCFIINLDLLTYAGNLFNLEDIANNSRYHFIHGDIRNTNLLRELFSEHNIDTVIHFAAESHVDRSIAAPGAFIETNIVGTFNLLEAAKYHWLDRKLGTADQVRFHHISTDEVYGSLAVDSAPSTEVDAYQPNSPYAASKASADHLVRAYHETYKLPVTISNCSNNYGPYQHSEKFIPTVINACLNQQQIPIYGDGSNIRDWLYVLDHCKAIDAIVAQGRLGQSYNVGANNELNNLELAITICHIFDTLHPKSFKHESLITLVDDRAGHDWRYGLNHQKISHELGWHPQHNFLNGLKETIRFFEQQLVIEPL